MKRVLNYENVINPVDVYDKYVSKYPNTKVSEVELESKYGLYIYEIEGYDNDNRYELKINSLDGEIVKEKIGRNKDSIGDITREDIEKVPAIVKSTLEDVGEKVYLHEWEVEFKKGY